MIGTAMEAKGGVSVVVGVLRDSGLFDRCGIEYIATHRYGNAVVKLIAAFAGWLRYISRLLCGKVELLHVHMASNASFWRKVFFLVPSFVCRIPVIVHLHGGEFRNFYSTQSGPVARRLIRFVFEKACRVIVLSDGWREWALSVFPRAHVETVLNPVVLPAVKHNSMREESTLLFLGRVVVTKGAFDLIDAVARLRSRFPRIRLLIGGDGDTKAAKKRAREHGIDPNVEILGWVHHADKQALLAKATVYVLPSYNEGLPMGMLEAMAAGVPVVVTAVGGIPDAVSDGIEGFLVQPGDNDELVDRVAVLLGDAGLRRRMGLAGRRRIEMSFARDNVISQLESVYEDILGSVAKSESAALDSRDW